MLELAILLMTCLIKHVFQDLNLSVSNVITGINELKKLTKHISCQCRFDGRKYNSDQWWNNDKCQCEFKNHHICEEDNVCNPATGSCENRKYLASIMDDTAIIFDEVIDAKKDVKSNEEETKTVPTNFNEKK